MIHMAIILLTALGIARDTGHSMDADSFQGVSLPVVPGSKGDVDGNGAIEIFDLIRARNISLGSSEKPQDSQLFAGDIDSDGSLDRDDVSRIRQILLKQAVPPPTLFSLNPASGYIGDQVTLTGAGFDSLAMNNSVRFNGLEAGIVDVAPARLTVIVPQGAGSGDVTVVAGTQSSNPIRFEVMLPLPAPMIERIMPSAALRGETVVIEGVRFGESPGGSGIKIGSTAVARQDILSWSDLRIEVRVPAVAFPGQVVVTAHGALSNAVDFNVIVVQITVPDSADIMKKDGVLPYVKNEIILNFHDDVTLDEISRFLEQHGMEQAGMIYRSRKIQARIEDGMDPFALAESLSGEPLLEGAAPSLCCMNESAVSESYPRAILDAYSRTTAMFGSVPGFKRYHHFAMRTYAGHRLAEKIIEAYAGSGLPDVRIAILDGGLGDGKTVDPVEFGFRIKAPVDVGFREAFLYASVANLTDIPDAWSGHGTGLAGMAAGGGQNFALGTGKHVNIRPIKIADINGTANNFIIAGGLEIAMADPCVRVINFSRSSYLAGASETVLSAARYYSQVIWQDELEALLDKGIIFVASSGNENMSSKIDWPRYYAPDEPRLGWFDPNIMVVSGTRLTGIYQKPAGRLGYADIKWENSNSGSNVSVCAPAQFDDIVLDRDFTATSSEGTSLSAPLVSGLAAEMILLDKILVNAGKRPQELTPNRIVRLIKETADDLGATSIDPVYGYGRINVWKALLAVINGGTPSQVNDPEWYGFDIRASTNGASRELMNIFRENFKFAGITVNGQALIDAGNTNVPWEEINLYKLVPPPYDDPPIQGEVDRIMIPMPHDDHQNSQFMASFSLSREEFSQQGQSLKKLELRKMNSPVSAAALFSCPLDQVVLMDKAMRDMGVVDFDDYIFTVQVPRITDIRSPVDGSNRTVTEKVNNKEVMYVIGAAGDPLELSLVYPNPDFSPDAANTIVEFFSEKDRVQAVPDQIADSLLKMKISEGAGTGPVVIHQQTPAGTGLMTFSSVAGLIVPRVVDITAQGFDTGDSVRIAIEVPHFDPAKEGYSIKIQFPGSAVEIAPEKITSASEPGITHYLATKIPEFYEDGALKIKLTVDGGRTVEIRGNISRPPPVPFNSCMISMFLNGHYNTDTGESDLPLLILRRVSGSFEMNRFTGSFDSTAAGNDFGYAFSYLIDLDIEVTVDLGTYSVTSCTLKCSEEKKHALFADWSVYEKFVVSNIEIPVKYHSENYVYCEIEGTKICEYRLDIQKRNDTWERWGYHDWSELKWPLCEADDRIIVDFQYHEK